MEADDGSPIVTAGYSCMTITSCNSIGISLHPIAVRGVLDAIFDYAEEFEFLPRLPEKEETS